jgi:hypothetical protein
MDNGNIYINDGAISVSIEAYQNSHIYISGGTVRGTLYARENGIITLEGNNFRVGNVYVNGFLNIPYLLSVGALTENSGGSSYYTQYDGLLRGELADGTALQNGIEIFYRPQMNGANFNVIPEPTTLLLLGLGAVMLKRKH